MSCELAAMNRMTGSCQSLCDVTQLDWRSPETMDQKKADGATFVEIAAI